MRLFGKLDGMEGASFLVAVHYPSDARSTLPQLLARRSSMTASHPNGGEPLREGHIYVAPPGSHLFVRGEQVCVDSGPKENHQRPSIDRLFRSAAAHDGRTTGVVLSGSLRDGAMGLRAIVGAGGRGLIQEPEEAAFSAMPRAAADAVPGAEIMNIEGIAARLREPARGEPSGGSAEGRDDAQEPSPGAALTPFTCPDCHGTLFETGDGAYACRVGHRFSPAFLLEAMDGSVEVALWAAVRVLQERHDLASRIAEKLRERGAERSSEYFEDRAREARANAQVITRLVAESRREVKAGNEPR